LPYGNSDDLPELFGPLVITLDAATGCVYINDDVNATAKGTRWRNATAATWHEQFRATLAD
jgi:hypothetical protein